MSMFQRYLLLFIYFSATYTFSTLATDPYLQGQPIPDLQLDSKQEAAQLYLLAQSYYAERQWAKAAQMLELAFDLDPHSVIAHNCAKASENSGNLEKAKRMYTLSLTLDPDPETKERAEIALLRIQNTQEELRVQEELHKGDQEPTKQLLSLLEINSDPPNSYVKLGKFTVGKSPYQGTHVAGRYPVMLEHEGYLPYSTVLELEPGKEMVLQVVLEEEPSGRLWTWIAGAAGLGLAATGTIFYVQAKDSYDTLNTVKAKRWPQEDFEALKEEGRSQLLRSYIFYGLSAAAITATIILFFIEAPEDPDKTPYEDLSSESKVKLWIPPEGGIGVRGIF